MSKAEDFIPREAEIEQTAPIHMGEVENLAEDEDIVGNVRQSVSEYDSRFTSQRQDWFNEDTGICNQADAAFRSFVNDSSVQSLKKFGANEPDKWERAKVTTTQFYRHVTQKAANGYSIQSSREMPFKYQAVHDGSDKMAEIRGEKMNLLAKWSMKKDHFNVKSIDFWTMVEKYGNIPVMVEWLHKRGKKVVKLPAFNDAGELDGFTFEEVETVIENRPETTLIPIEALKADTQIGDINAQECVIISSVCGMTEIVDGIRSGYYRDDMIKDLSKAHQWDGYSGFENEGEKKDNRALENQPSGANSGQYLRREVFINIPVEDGKWDEEKNVPMRFRVTMFGNDPISAVVARIERNQEPDDTIPIKMVHANPDDADILYHISAFEVIRNNLSVENTLVRQIIDNNTLVNKPPLKEVSGQVQGNDRTFGPDARFICDTLDSIEYMTVRDVSQPSIALLEYMKEDSNTANSIDKNMVGESFGARTSASEAGTIASHSQRPTLVNVEYVLEQFLGFVAQRYKVGWEAYGLPEQVIQITDSNGDLVRIRPDDISGEFDIVIDVMNDVKEDALKANRMLNYAQAVATTPMAETVDWAALNEELAQRMMGTTKFVKANAETDAETNALNNLVVMLQNGTRPELEDGMNLKKHLEVYESERNRWRGREEQNEFVTSVLDPVIAELKGRVSTPAQAAALPEVGAAEQSRQELSGLLGG